MRFNLISYNIRKGKGVMRSEPAIADISRELSAKEPDFILCQEIADHGECQSHQMAHTLGCEHHYGPNAFRKKGSHGNTTFSRHPTTLNANLDISTNIFEDRGLLHVVTYLNSQHKVHVFNTHFGLTPWQRRRQCRALLDYINEHVPAEEPIIIAGDFNDFSGWVDKTLTQAGLFKNAMHGLEKHERKTWPSKLPLFNLDHVYYRHLDLVKTDVLNTLQWGELSDHLPVHVEFSLPSAQGLQAA